MIKKAAVAIGSTAGDFFNSWGAMAVFNPLFALLLVSLYLFLLTKESGVFQLAATGTLALAAVILFFLLQAAAAVRYARNESRPLYLFAQALNMIWKVVLITIPIALLAVLAMYLLNKLQAHFPLPAPAETTRATLAPLGRIPQKPVVPFSWTSVLLYSLRLLVLGIALPLVAIHLWIETVRNGLMSTMKKALRIIGVAFSAESLFIYGMGLLIFGLLPYFLVFTRTPVKNGWAELLIFGGRLAFAFALTLWGWIITVGALASVTGRDVKIESRSDQAVETNGMVPDGPS